MISTAILISTIVLLQSGVHCYKHNSKINATYISSKDSLHIWFNTSGLKYSSYEVKVFKSLSPEICYPKSEAATQKAVVESSLPEVEIPGPYFPDNYCIRVTPTTPSSCGRDCIGNQIIYIDTTDCCNWNPILDVYKESNHDKTYLMRFHMSVSAEFQPCFSYMNLTLWYNVSSCDGASGHVKDWTSITVAPNYVIEEQFDHLPPGNYCFRLAAYQPYCIGKLVMKRSKVEFLASLSPEHGQVLGAPPASSSPDLTWLYVLIGGVAIITVIFGAVLYCKKDNRFSRLPVFPRNDLTTADLSAMATETAKNHEVVLLGSQDFMEHVDTVKALYSFLLNSFGLPNVRFDVYEEPSICIDLHSWVESIIESKPNRRYIIVESEGPVLQENAKKNRQHMQPKDEDFLNDVFPYALSLLKDRTRGLTDYRNIFVIRFGYTPQNVQLTSFVPNRRYELPKHFFELYCALLNLPRASVSVMEKFEDEMKRKWEGPQLQTLRNQIAIVSRIIEENPQLVKESFVKLDPI